MPNRTITEVRNAPDDADDNTGTNILATSAGAFVGLFLLVWLIQRRTRPNPNKSEGQKSSPLDPTQVLHYVAAAVHLTSAFAIFGSAVWDRSDRHMTLKRYSVRPDWDASQFFEPQGWDLRCFNLTTQRLSGLAAQCHDSLASVYSNKHRGDGGFLNIAWAAFVFAAWSGLCHLYAGQWLQRRRGTSFSAAVVKLTAIRWIDYLVSAPTMLLTINIIFAATNLSGVIASPLLLFLLRPWPLAANIIFSKRNCR